MHRQKKDLEFCIGKQNWKYVNILVAYSLYTVLAVASVIRGFNRVTKVVADHGSEFSG